jgi:stress-induced morphogen
MIAIQEIKELIEKSIPNSSADVQNPMMDNKHFEITVASKDFKGLPLLDQHRMVHRAIKHLLDNEIHAINIKTNEE